MLVFNTMLLKGNSENGTFSVAVFGVIYTMSTIPGAMFDGAGAAASTVISILGGEKDWKGMLAVYHDGLRIVAAAGMIMALFFAAGAKNILIFFGLNDGPALETAASRISYLCIKRGSGRSECGNHVLLANNRKDKVCFRVICFTQLRSHAGGRIFAD